jgi:5-methylcytosine-specific restriction enzyme B
MAGPTLSILYGPPGTGKTWRAARDAVRVIQPDISDDLIASRHTELVSYGQIIWVTFHPSYTYEDFVEGFRPEATDQGIMFNPRPGPFRVACDSVTKTPPLGQRFYVGQTLESSTGGSYQVVAASSDSVTLKNLKSGKGSGLMTPVSLHLIERLMQHGLKAGELSLPGTAHEEKVNLAKQLGFDMQSLFGMTGPLRTVWENMEHVAPPANERRPVVLVIDEINRADLSRVFGELITLIEPDKRIGAAEERRIMLPYSQVVFGVPPELHIIGTMNTSDRSLSAMDMALRRRFDFIEVMPDSSRCAYPFASLDLRELLASWNMAVSAVLSRELQIGHAFLEMSTLKRTMVNEQLPDTPDGQLRAVAHALRRSIVPLLLEAARGDWETVDFILGRNFEKSASGLLEEVDLTAVRARAGGVIDVVDKAAFRLPDWWDPTSGSWDGDRFRGKLEAGLTV